MNINEAILARRSIRKFSDKKVDDLIIIHLLEAAMAAPSACNKTPWEFYVIKDEEINHKLEDKNKFYTYESPLKIVVCGNEENFLPGVAREYWTQDVSAAIENILLSSLEYNLGTCWCGVYPALNRVKMCQEILSLDNKIIPLGIICVGYPLEDKEARTQYDENKVHII